MAMQIQQEKYQAEYDIHDVGPNNYDLGVGLTYPNRGQAHPVPFGITRYDGEEVSVGVILTSLAVTGRTSDRQKWEFEGILWNWNVYSKREGSTTIRARVKGTYDSHAREGKLYVLAHEQPIPFVEVLSWDEMCERVKTYDLAIFKMCGRNGAWDAKIDYLVEASHRNEKLSMKCTVDLYHFLTAGAVSPPLALADGRVLFSTDGLDCTIYKPGTYGKK